MRVAVVLVALVGCELVAGCHRRPSRRRPPLATLLPLPASEAASEAPSSAPPPAESSPLPRAEGVQVVEELGGVHAELGFPGVELHAHAAARAIDDDMERRVHAFADEVRERRRRAVAADAAAGLRPWTVHARCDASLAAETAVEVGCGFDSVEGGVAVSGPVETFVFLVERDVPRRIVLMDLITPAARRKIVLLAMPALRAQGAPGAFSGALTPAKVDASLDAFMVYRQGLNFVFPGEDSANVTLTWDQLRPLARRASALPILEAAVSSPGAFVYDAPRPRCNGE